MRARRRKMIMRQFKKKETKKILDQLRKRGSFDHNQKVIEQGKHPTSSVFVIY